MVGSAAAVYANDDPVLTACAVARNTDAQIREMMDDFYDSVIDKIVALLEQDAEARPISDDLPALVRTLAAATTMTLTHDSTFVGRGERSASRGRHRRAAVVVRALGWPELAASRSVRSPPWRRERLCGQALLSHGGRQRHRPGDRVEAGRRRRRAVSDRSRRRGPGRRPSPTPVRWAAVVPEHRVLDISDFDAVAGSPPTSTPTTPRWTW